MKRATLSDFAETDPASDGDEREPSVTFAVGRDQPCVRCGSGSRRQWRTDDGFVCPACVEW